MLKWKKPILFVLTVALTATVTFVFLDGFEIKTKFLYCLSELETWKNAGTYYTFSVSFWKLSFDFILNFK